VQDELIWAAGWLYKATGLAKYLQYAVDNSSLSYWISEFQWENKNAGLQVLLSSVCNRQTFNFSLNNART
jgi:hypothetical protein